VANPDIAVVIPTHQHLALVSGLLETLAGQTLGAPRFEVVVVDDCSSDGTAAALRDLAPSLPFACRVLTTPTNGGPAAARNLGWQSTVAPVVAFLDDDCVPSPGWLVAGLDALGTRSAIGVVQGRTRLPEGASVHRLTDWYLWRVVEGPTPWFEGCNLFFRRDVLEQTGGFDEDIRYYGEDCAAGWRVLEAGFESAYASEAAVTHPVERRGFRWFVRNGFLESRTVHCAAKHPGFRRAAFWRPWAMRREDPAFVIALAGVAAGIFFWPAFVLVLPYVWWQRPSVRRLSFFRLCLQVPLVDAARLAGHLRGSARHRIFVL
jgi:GT2 family glycosyltransferase